VIPGVAASPALVCQICGLHEPAGTTSAAREGWFWSCGVCWRQGCPRCRRSVTEGVSYTRRQANDMCHVGQVEASSACARCNTMLQAQTRHRNEIAPGFLAVIGDQNRCTGCGIAGPEAVFQCNNAECRRLGCDLCGVFSQPISPPAKGLYRGCDDCRNGPIIGPAETRWSTSAGAWRPASPGEDLPPNAVYRSTRRLTNFALDFVGRLPLPMPVHQGYWLAAACGGIWPFQAGMMMGMPHSWSETPVLQPIVEFANHLEGLNEVQFPEYLYYVFLRGIHVGWLSKNLRWTVAFVWRLLSSLGPKRTLAFLGPLEDGSNPWYTLSLAYRCWVRTGAPEGREIWARDVERFTAGQMWLWVMSATKFPLSNLN